MDTRLYYTSLAMAPEPIEEISAVTLIESIDLGPVGHIPAGTVGTVVFVHEGGAAYEVEFSSPLYALVTLLPAQIRAVAEATRERVIAASGGVLHRY